MTRCQRWIRGTVLSKLIIWIHKHPSSWYADNIVETRKCSRSEATKSRYCWSWLSMHSRKQYGYMCIRLPLSIVSKIVIRAAPKRASIVWIDVRITISHFGYALQRLQRCAMRCNKQVTCLMSRARTSTITLLNGPIRRLLLEEIPKGTISLSKSCKTQLNSW